MTLGAVYIFKFGHGEQSTSCNLTIFLIKKQTTGHCVYTELVSAKKEAVLNIEVRSKNKSLPL